MGFRPARKALIRVGYACNNNCSFCHTLDLRPAEETAATVERKIARAKALAHDMVVLSGGEPTMRPELRRWAALSQKCGLQLGLVTNGRMLSYEKLVDDLVGHGLTYTHLSVHGGNAELHNGMVRADAFEQTLCAVGNLRDRGVEVTAA